MSEPRFRPLDEDTKFASPLFKALNNIPANVTASQVTDPAFTCTAYHDGDDHGVMVSKPNFRVIGAFRGLASVYAKDGKMVVKRIQCSVEAYEKILCAVRACTDLPIMEA